MTFSLDFTGKTGRKCAGCTLCCKLVPTAELDKPSGVRCKHQRTGRGCAIYATRPSSCRLWSCVWLTDPDAADLRRPDRVHYVIDIMPDFVTMTFDDGREPQRVPVVQVWVDPAHRHAYRDPALWAYLAKRGENEGMAAIIRFNNQEAVVLFPPALTPDGQWHEQGSNLKGQQQHSAAEVVAALNEAGLAYGMVVGEDDAA